MSFIEECGIIDEHLIAFLPQIQEYSPHIPVVPVKIATVYHLAFTSLLTHPHGFSRYTNQP